MKITVYFLDNFICNVTDIDEIPGLSCRCKMIFFVRKYQWFSRLFKDKEKDLVFHHDTNHISRTINILLTREKYIDNTYKRYINSYLIQTCDKNRSIYMLYFRIVAETSTSCVFSGSGLWKKGIRNVAHISISSPRNAKS